MWSNKKTIRKVIVLFAIKVFFYYTFKRLLSYEVSFLPFLPNNLLIELLHFILEFIFYYQV